MAKYVLHPITQRSLEQFQAQPTHAILLTGSAGSGKSSVAQYAARRLLNLDEPKFRSYPYVTTVRSEDGKAIAIDSIRDLQKFMTLKIPGANNIARVAIIEDAHLMTTEAQNALLKTLEEPPLDTVLILTATSPDALLPTIQSRVRSVAVIPPAFDDSKHYFASEGHTAADIDKAMLLSGGLPGLTHALLVSEQGHPLFEATTTARTILQSTAFDRLVLVDSLAKQKQLCIDSLYIMGQMSRMAIWRGAANTATTKRWQNIMKAAYQAADQLRHNTQPKLVLTNLMLQL